MIRYLIDWLMGATPAQVCRRLRGRACAACRRQRRWLP